MRQKKFSLILLVLVLAVEIISLVWIRGDYRSVMEQGKEYQVPAQIDFKGDFYHRNYLALSIPYTEAPWRGTVTPEQGEEVYLALDKDKDGMMTITGASDGKPVGDYLLVRVSSYLDGNVYFTFPATRMYMSQEQLKKLSVVELSERVQVKNEISKKTETHMKNEVTALLHIQDGRAVVAKVMANGSPIEQTFTTIGKNINVKYAKSPEERDQYSTRINKNE